MSTAYLRSEHRLRSFFWFALLLTCFSNYHDYTASAQNADELPIVNNTALTYNQALGLAMNDSLDIKIAEGNADVSSAVEAIAKTQQMPSISATTYGAYGDSSNVLTSSPEVLPQNIFNAPSGAFGDQNLTLSVPILTSGKQQKQNLSSRLSRKSSDLAETDSRLSVSEQVTESYAAAALDKQLIDVAQAHLNLEDEQVRITQESVDQGHSAPVELLREQAAQADASQSLISAKNNEDLALASLKDVLGLSQTSALAVSDSLDVLVATQSQVPESLAAALAKADNLSPSLKSAQYIKWSAAADIGAAKSAFGPQVYGVIMADSTAERGGSRTGYTLGVSASLPLYDDGQRADEVNEAKAKANIAENTAKKVREDVEENVVIAWLNLQSANAEEDSASIGLTAAQQSYALADMRYNAGKSIAAERLDALAEFVRSQEAVAAAKLSIVVAKAKLIDSIGG